MHRIEIAYLSDALAMALSLAIIVGYYLLLRARVRANPGYTIQAMLNQARRAWVARIIKHDEALLGVQTLRNLIMTTTFYASTAVVLLIGTVTLAAQVDKLSGVWLAFSPFGAIGAIDEHLWLIKVMTLLIDLLCAFVFFAQTIRLLSHVSLMLVVTEAATPERTIANLLIQAGRYHTRGMRCYYFAVPLLFWLFGPLFLILATCGLVFALYNLDKAPAGLESQSDRMAD